MTKKVLIVDDDPSLVRMLEAKLTDHGYEVVTAFDGKDGLDKATTISPDLIILDVIMPELSGTVLCGILKYDEDYSSIPIILLTVKDQEQDRKVGEMVRADAYITKPFEFENILTTVKNLLKET